MREWLAAANLVLGLANQPESIGINILQAIHLGTPVVGWNKAAFNEILRPLYPQGLVKENTAYALCKVIRSQLENVMRPSITDKFTMQQMIDETLEVYSTLYDANQLSYSDTFIEKKRLKKKAQQNYISTRTKKHNNATKEKQTQRNKSKQCDVCQ